MCTIGPIFALYVIKYECNLLTDVILWLWTGLDVETRLNFQWTPLMLAVSVADYNLAELLLERGANASFHKGQKPLRTD